MLNQHFQSCEIDFLRYIINNSEEETAVIALDGTIAYANDSMVRNHQLDENYAGNSAVFDLAIDELDAKHWADFLNSIRANGNTLVMQVEKKSDATTSAYYNIKASLSEINGQEAVWLFCKNVTNSIIQEKKITDLNYVMDAILSNIPVYLFVKDSANDFRYIYWNKAFEYFSKIPAKKVIGNTDFEVFPNRADAEKFRKDDLTLLESGKAIEFDEEYIDSSGETRYCHTLKSLIHNDHALPWLIGVSWDITDMKNAEKELTASRIKAEESDRLKSAFLANMSHELRTPLNAIVGFSRILCDESSCSEHKQYYDIIDDNANMLIQLINDILDISKIEAGILEFVENNVQLSEMMEDTYEVHRQRVAEDVTLVYEPGPQDITIRCDRHRLQQVLTNFLNNAIKFTRAGEIRYGFKLEGDDIVFFVKDTGMGIAKEHIGSVFNRFTKLNNFIQGTGLGLSICNTIADKMKGKMWVESEEHVGSTFYFSIPYDEYNVTGVEECRSVPDLIVRAANEAKKSILVAEEADSNYLLTNSLLSAEYDLMRAVDGEDLLAKFTQLQPDLILTELKLSKLDGCSVIREIRKESDIPIVVMTSCVYEADRKEALESGCNDFITKPVSVDTLRRVLRKYI